MHNSPQVVYPLRREPRGRLLSSFPSTPLSSHLPILLLSTLFLSSPLLSSTPISPLSFPPLSLSFWPLLSLTSLLFPPLFSPLLLSLPFLSHLLSSSTCIVSDHLLSYSYSPLQSCAPSLTTCAFPQDPPFLRGDSSIKVPLQPSPGKHDTLTSVLSDLKRKGPSDTSSFAPPCKVLRQGTAVTCLGFLLVV